MRRAQTWTEDPTPRLFNQEFARAEGAERYLRRGSATGPKPDRPDGATQTGAAVVPVLAATGRRESVIIKWLSWMAEQTPN
jgi:hypothetical protein